MKKITILLSIISCVFIFSCEKKSEIQTTPELQQIFNDTEIGDIGKIISFYEEHLKKQTNSNQIDSAFHKFAKENVNAMSYDVSGFDDESIQRLYKNIDQETYDEIWEESKGFNYEINDSITIQNIAYEKKFMNYLKLVGEKEPKIQYVHNQIKTLGMVQGILIRTLYQDFDDEGRNGKFSTKIGDYNNRFIAAVFTITIADNIIRQRMIRKQQLKIEQSESGN
ncbi:hypothetical protein U8527_06350 [Kordia algicida OT-1]|uniref:Uncharacterized protein n=1 Tax=Kordia algicida OT-1 TaxID=391587 RepID=A9E1M5_9FLAO|nr:hypothetical protein [Kordia algicida]EDP95648.1 hypothetical protein KAOT1_22391 [Kordia algicida OT-1]